MVAFSGGCDSTALLAALTRIRPAGSCVAAHLDHGLDGGSAQRALRATRIARQLGVEPVTSRRRGEGRPPRGLEAAARARRYRFLEEVRLARGARFVLTAHHRDDQAETVLLRILFGSGLQGLRGIAPRRGSILRPLLDVPRIDLIRWLEIRDLRWLEDPGNEDLARPRNRIRHLLMPRLSASDPALTARLARLADRARQAAEAVAATAARRVALDGPAEAATLDVERLRALPPDLRPWALAALHQRAGRSYPPGKAARRELERRLATGSSLECDCGDGWRWFEEGGRLGIAAAESRVLRRAHPFSYTLRVPGRVHLHEIHGTMRLERRKVSEWMFRGAPHRAGLALPLSPGDLVQVRNRRPGDRIRPLGSLHRCRLKDLLIDRRVPRDRRDQLPLLCVDGRIAWVPGVTIDEAFRLDQQDEAWVVEIEPS